jgi:transglutaminase-like putative cysteine protease
VADGYAEYLTVPDALEVPADLVARVVELRQDTPGATAAAVCRLVHEQVEHVAGTEARERVAQAWERRAGSAEDLADLTIAALRGFGLPARYVGGYRHPDPSAAAGAELASAPHSWVEWWDDGWRAHDPAYGCEVADAHVVVGVGRDHGDVRPLSGVCAGASGVERAVEVRMTRLG